MNDIAALLQVVASIALITLPPIAIGRALRGADEGPTLFDALATPIDPPWPRGVQEEEPVRWRVAALQPRRDAAGRPADAAADLRSNRPVVAGFGTESGQC